MNKLQWFVIFLVGVSTAGLAYFLSLQAPSTTTELTTTPQSPSTTNAWMIFSANFASGGDCRDHYVQGCDLFTAKVNLDTGEASEVQALVTSDQIGETFPRLPASAKNIVSFNRSTANGEDRGTDTAMLYDFNLQTVITLMERATMPFPSPDGSEVYVNAVKDHSLQVSPIDSLNFQTVEGIENVHEPHVAPNGNIVFYQTSSSETRGSNTAQGMLYIASQKKTVPLTEANGSAHCFWNASGTIAYCNNAVNGGIFAYSVSEDGTVGTGTLAIPLPTAKALSSIDPAFSPDSCKAIDVAYGEFCDDSHLVLMAGCYSSNGGKKTGQSDQILSETMLYNLDKKSYLPIGKTLAEVYGGLGTSTYTATCRAE